MPPIMPEAQHERNTGSQVKCHDHREKLRTLHQGCPAQQPENDHGMTETAHGKEFRHALDQRQSEDLEPCYRH